MAAFHYYHVYLSPHLDDAVLSCGGLIHRQAMAGEYPLVITLFAGQPPGDVDLSDFAQLQHTRWGIPGRIAAARWTEDQAALARLNADYLRLNYPDCIYRGREHAGEWYYASEEALFGVIHPAEQRLPTELAATLTQFIPREDSVTLYSPLTIGNHVDHQLTFAAAHILEMEGWRVRFYEDYPYVEKEGALSAALATRRAQDWQQVITPLSENDLSAKIQAIVCYKTQLDVLFGSAEAMPERVRRYANWLGGERLWQPDSDCVSVGPVTAVNR
jgi:LmbE family N-acetylglucosaminyl deacetylase